jgi:glycosyltransferase involved in cell wall biosynthesis
MFLSAVARVSDEIDILFVLPEQEVLENTEQGNRNELFSSYWGTKINIFFVKSKTAKKTLYNYYIAGIFHSKLNPKFSYYNSDYIKNKINKLLARNPDFVFVSRLGVMIPLLNGQSRPLSIFFDLDDVEHRVQIRTALQPPFWLGKLASIAQVPAVIYAERQAASASQAMFVCSEIDRKYLGRMGFPSSVRVIPNSVELHKTNFDIIQESTLMFIGGYNFPPNCSAAERLISLIWPTILKRLPQARLIIAGTHPELIPAFARRPDGVEFTGFVPELDPLYARVRVIACPIMVGGGTRLKLLEAASYTKPMVSTAVGAEGLAFRHGQEILIHDDNASFAEACIRLMGDDEECRKLGVAAHDMVAGTYDRQSIIQSISDIFVNSKFI